MIKDLEIHHEFHSYGKDDQGNTYKKYYLWVKGYRKGLGRQTMTALKEGDPIIPWIEVLYKQLVEDFEKEQTTPQESE